MDVRLIPTSITRKRADPNDPTNGLTLDALMARQKALREAAPQVPNQIASPWQGAALLGSTLVNQLQQQKAEEQEAAGRQKLAQTMAGINYDTGATPEQVAQMSLLDPDVGQRMAADAIQARRAKMQQEATWGHEAEINTRELGEAQGVQAATWGHEATVNDRERLEAEAIAAAKAKSDLELNEAKTDRWDDFTDPKQPGKLLQRNARTGEVKEKGTQTRVTASDLKSQYGQEDTVVSLDNTLKNLDRAFELNPTVPVGRVAQAQATLHGNYPDMLPGKEMLTGTDATADASKEFWGIMDEAAITAMTDTLKGATTDSELAQFKSILSDPSSSAIVRGRTIDRMRSLARRQRDMAQARLNDLKGTSGTDLPTAPPTASALPEGVTEEDITETMRLRGMTREEVLAKLGGANAGP